jgi:putative ATPase
MRPIDLKDFLGQEEIVGEGKLLRQAIKGDNLPSMIFWGPPGSGKTTLAFIIAKQTKSDFIQFSAVTSGVEDLRKTIKRAEENKRLGVKTILFIDEIHRWNKSQQDALLPHVERGTIILIGATTENPSFEVRGALLSRSRVFVLNRLTADDISAIIKRALTDKEAGFGNLKIKIEKEAINALAKMSNGDARTALNVLEYAISSNLTLRPHPTPLLRKEREIGFVRRGGKSSPSLRRREAEGGTVANAITITTENIKEAFQKSHLLYDKDGEERYNIISALHKSMRGSDANAALYWLARMLEAGEDPLFVARRLVRFASEDVGLANSRALEQAVSAFNACRFIGMPECNVILAQVVVYLSKCEKSNDLYIAYGKAAADVKEYGNLPVPLHIRSAPTKLMKDLNYGKDYKYSPNFNYKEKQEYLPEELKGRKYLK